MATRRKQRKDRNKKIAANRMNSAHVMAQPSLDPREVSFLLLGVFDAVLCLHCVAALVQVLFG
jgi:uncharacterized membrane protein